MDKKIKLLMPQKDNSFLFMLLWLFFRFGGFYIAYLSVYIFAIYYSLFDIKKIKSASAYLQHRFPGASLFRIRMLCYRLFVSWGKQSVDKIAAAIGGVNFNFTNIGEAKVRNLLKEDKGFILLNAHAGNWQLAFNAFARENLFKKRVFFIINPRHKKASSPLFNFSKQNPLIQILSPEIVPNEIVNIMKQLKNGYIVSFMGDRPYTVVRDKVYAATTGQALFLGNQAAFPLMPFAIAAASHVPIIVLLAIKTGWKSYNIQLEHINTFVYQGKKHKRVELLGLAQKYADILSDCFQKEPYQWFLFYDVWNHMKK